ncbi:MAG: hypothetical protein A2Y12_07560 [Planctomycetes bacterium GWF2_42_9]|nr:MAG: hypothetical protein A2Y12_07560 [Planctomycetes bacterium GWF2_42_9]HAL45703.1 hypothetical protein [Phycisphaerales bacterium]
MDKRQIAIKLAVNTLGINFSVGSFQDRLILQKSVYLSQVAGVNFGYHYRWYLKGPYCNTLADDCYAVVHNEAEYNGWTLDEASSAVLKSKVKPLLNESTPDKLAKKLELLASVHFLIDRGQVSKSNIAGIVEVLKNNNKNFEYDEVKNALEELERYGLIGQEQNNS